MARRLITVPIVALFTVLSLVCGAGAAHAAKVPPPTQVCTFGQKPLNGVSGMTLGIRNRGVLWVTNGADGGPTIYAVDAATCAVRATIELARVAGRNLQAIASGRDDAGQPVLWIGDFGDAKEEYPFVRIYQIPEPSVKSQTVDVRAWRYRYPEGSRNTEALVVDALKPHLWVVTKELIGGAIYALPPLPPVGLGEVWTTPLVATQVAPTTDLITDAAMSNDNSRFVLRTLVTAEVFGGLPPGNSITTLNMPTEPQGSAIAWASDGRSLYVAGAHEGILWNVPLPDVAWTRTAQKKAAADLAAGGQSSSISTYLLIGAGLIAALLGLNMLRLRRRDRQSEFRFEQRARGRR